MFHVYVLSKEVLLRAVKSESGRMKSESGRKALGVALRLSKVVLTSCFVNMLISLGAG